MGKKSFVLCLAAASLALAAGCKSSTTPPDEETFLGTWNATKAEFTSMADPATKVDIVAQGSTVTLVFEATAAVLTILEPGQDAVVYNATWSASADVLTLTWTSPLNGEAQFDYALVVDDLTMDGGHVPFEFTDGDPEEAILNMTLVRQ